MLTSISSNGRAVEVQEPGVPGEPPETFVDTVNPSVTSTANPNSQVQNQAREVDEASSAIPRVNSDVSVPVRVQDQDQAVLDNRVSLSYYCSSASLIIIAFGLIGIAFWQLTKKGSGEFNNLPTNGTAPFNFTAVPIFIPRQGV